MTAARTRSARTRTRSEPGESGGERDVRHLSPCQMLDSAQNSARSDSGGGPKVVDDSRGTPIPEEARGEALRWTSIFIDEYVSGPSLSPARLTGSRRPVPLAPLDDVRQDITSFGQQLRLLDSLGLRTPALVSSPTGVVVPMNLGSLSLQAIPTNRDEATEWVARAREATIRIASGSHLSYEELPLDQAVNVVHDATVAFITTRFTSAIFQNSATTVRFPVRVHTKARNLNVHWSRAICWNPIFFGAPTTPVEGTLEAGRYQFGVIRKGMEMRKDGQIFSIPPTEDAYLIVA